MGILFIYYYYYKYTYKRVRDYVYTKPEFGTAVSCMSYIADTDEIQILWSRPIILNIS